MSLMCGYKYSNGTKEVDEEELFINALINEHEKIKEVSEILRKKKEQIQKDNGEELFRKIKRRF